MKNFFIAVLLLQLGVACSSNTFNELPDEAAGEDSADTFRPDKTVTDKPRQNDTGNTDKSDIPDNSQDNLISTDSSITDPESDALIANDSAISSDTVADIDNLADTENNDNTAPDTDEPACTVVPVPEQPTEDPLPTVADPGVVESVKNGNFTDYYLYSNSAKTFKVGVRAEWGASLVFFGFANNDGSNVIDANDTGREVQIAIYDPDRIMQNCAWNASCKTTPTTCANSITFLGWNPVQGGNRCNNGSPVESVGGGSGQMTASVVPYQWNPAWDRQDCVSDVCSDTNYNKRLSDMRYIQRLRWIGSNVVEMKMTVQNLTAIERGVTLQEFPTYYAPYGAHGLANYNTLLDSDGNQIAIDIPANDGFFYKDFSSPGGWVTLQKAEKDYGAALYYENRLTQFQGWQKAGIFNNVRSKIAFGLPANGTVNARAYLILGSFATVKGLAEGIDTAIAPFGILDQPASDETITGDTLTLGGWVLDNKGVALIEVLIDGVVSGTASLNTDRPDVCKVWPGYSMCPKTGYTAQIAISSLSACPHLLEIRAKDTDNNTRIIARKRFYKGGSNFFTFDWR